MSVRAEGFFPSSNSSALLGLPGPRRRGGTGAAVWGEGEFRVPGVVASFGSSLMHPEGEG